MIAFGIAGVWASTRFFTTRDTVTTQTLALDPGAGVEVTLVSRSRWQPRPRSFNCRISIDLRRTPVASTNAVEESLDSIVPSIAFQAAAPEELPTTAQLEEAFRTLLERDPEDESGRPLSQRAAAVLYDVLAPDRIWDAPRAGEGERMATVLYPFTTGGGTVSMFWKTSWTGRLVQLVPALLAGIVAWRIVRRHARSRWWRPVRPGEWASVGASSIGASPEPG